MIGHLPVDRWWPLWLCGSSEILASQLFRFLIPVFATFLLSASSEQIGTLVSAFNLPVLFASAVIGPFVSRYSASGVVRTCAAVASGLLLLACVLQLSTGLGYGGLLVVCLLTGVAFLAFEVGFAVLVPHALPTDRLVPFNSRLEISQSVVHLLAPASIAVFSSPILSVYALGLLAALMALSALSCPVVRVPTQRLGGTFAQQLKRGFAFVAQVSPIRSLTLRLFIWNGVDAAFVTLLFPYWVTDSRVSPATVAACFALNGAGVVLGATAAGRLLRRIRLGTAVLGAMLIASICALTFVLVPPVDGLSQVVALMASALMGSMVAVYRVAHVSLRQALVPAALLAEVTGSMRFVTSLAIPIAPIVVGFSAAAVGNGTVLLAVSTAAMVFALISIPLSPLRRQFEAAAA